LKKYSIYCLIFTLTAIIAGEVTAQNTERAIGVNLSDIGSFASQIMFVDAIKQSSSWLVQPADGSVFSIEEVNGDPVEIPSRSDGYPTHVPFEFNGQQLRVHLLALSAQPESILYPPGIYTLLFEGTGEIIIDIDVPGAPQSFTEPDTPHEVEIAPSAIGIQIIIAASDINDPVRNIRLIMPGFEDVYQENPFHPDFLATLPPFEALRFMKPTTVEENTIISWEQRTTPDMYTYNTIEEGQIRLGLPYEFVIELSNLVQKDPWINIPHAADDGYIQNMAELFARDLDDGLNVYVEYSNETWNPSYPLTHEFLTEQGRSLFPSLDGINANQQFHVVRSLQIFDLFNSAFDAHDKLSSVRPVIATQAFEGVGRIVIDALTDPEINPLGTLPYGIAIAPYIGVEIIQQLQEEGIADEDVTADLILDRLHDDLQNVPEFVESFSFWADSLGIRLMAYEGGQHVTSPGFAPNSEPVQEAIVTANNDPRMIDIYCNYFDLWYDDFGGGLFMTFTLTEKSTVGSFGLLESTFQPFAESVKWQAHEECVFDKTATPTETPVDIPNKVFLQQNYPNPFNPVTTIEFSINRPGRVTLKIFDLLGREVLNLLDQNLSTGTHSFTVNASNLTSGVYFYQLKTAQNSLVRKMTLIK